MKKCLLNTAFLNIFSSITYGWLGNDHDDRFFKISLHFMEMHRIDIIFMYGPCFLQSYLFFLKKYCRSISTSFIEDSKDSFFKAINQKADISARDLIWSMKFNRNITIFVGEIWIRCYLNGIRLAHCRVKIQAVCNANAINTDQKERQQDDENKNNKQSIRANCWLFAYNLFQWCKFINYFFALKRTYRVRSGKSSANLQNSGQCRKTGEVSGHMTNANSIKSIHLHKIRFQWHFISAENVNFVETSMVSCAVLIVPVVALMNLQCQW